MCPAGDGPFDNERIAALRELHNAPPGGQLAEIAALFVSEAAQQVSALRDALTAGDRRAVAGLAHKLAGSSATLGARVLPDLCGQLERVATADDLSGARELLDVIAAEVDRLSAALRREFPPGLPWP